MLLGHLRIAEMLHVQLVKVIEMYRHINVNELKLKKREFALQFKFICKEGHLFKEGAYFKKNKGL